MLEINNSFKTKMKKCGKQINMLLNFGKTTIDKTYIKSAEPSVNGEMFTSIMRQLTLEVENYTSIEVDKILTVRQVNEMKLKDLNEYSVKYFTNEIKEDIKLASTINAKLGVRISEFEDYEYVDYGEYVVYDKEDVVDKNSTKLYLFDHLIDTHIKYDDDPLDLDYSDGEVTVRVLLQAICNKFGFILKTSSFANANKSILEDKYLGLNLTYRDILDEIAAVAGGFIKIFNKDLYVAYPQETGEIIDENDLEKLTLGKKIGAFNSLVLGRSPQEDNIYYPENMKAEDRVSVRIDNNKIMDSNREDFIVDIYNQINGLEYYIFEFTSFGFGYFEFGDIVTLKNLKGEEFKTLLFNIVENINSGIKGKSYTEEKNYSETKYEYATSIEKRITNTEIICNKQDNQIKLLIEKNSEYSQELTEIELNVNNITQRVESNSTDIHNNYQEIIQKLDNVPKNNDIITIQNKVETIENSTQYAINIAEEIQINGVSKVKTETGYTFNNEGLTIEKTNAKTKSTLNEAGLNIKDATGSNEESLLFAGYDNQTGETVVKSKNMTVEKYLTIGKYSRIEDYNIGTGVFWIGGD